MGMDSAVLLTTDATELSATAVLRALEEFPDKTASGNGLWIVTQASHLDGKLKNESSSQDVIISLAETPGHHSSARLAELARALKPGGSLIIQEPVAKTEVSHDEAQKLGANAGVVQTEALLQRGLLLAGFVSTSAFRAMDGVGLSADFASASAAYTGSDIEPLFHPLALMAKKPSWETGTSFSLRKKTVIKHDGVVKSNGTNGKVSLTDVNEFNINVTPAGNGVLTWKASVIGPESEELVDEDSLLTEEDLKRPDVPLVDDDCEVGQAGRKACKNCTCGRAEMEEDDIKTQPETKLTLGQINNPQSACGNCGLGDAFRCGGCPYRGLPAFKLGEKIALPTSLLAADV